MCEFDDLDLDVERLQSAPSRFRVDKTFRYYRSMLDVVDLDFVFVLIDPNVLIPIAMACLKMRLLFFVDKPLARDTGETSRLAEAAAKHGAFYMVATNRRILPVILKVKSLAD